jgi:hypothetical protein
MPTVKKVTKKAAPAAKPRPSPLAVDLFGSDDITVSVYGRSGTGKTTFWSTFPGPIRVILFSGVANPGELKSVAVADREKITAFVFNSTQELAELLQEPGDYATTVLDHASGLQDIILKEELGIDDIPVQKSWGLASRETWGAVAIKTKEFLRGILNQKGNIVIVSQEKAFTPDEDNDMITPYVGPALSPSVTGWLNPSCDYIVQTFLETEKIMKTVKVAGQEMEREVNTGKIKYKLRTGPHPVYTTKFRVPRGSVLPDAITDPTYEKIVTLINGE